MPRVNDPITIPESDFTVVQIEPGVFGFEVAGRRLGIKVSVDNIRELERTFGTPLLDTITRGVEQNLAVEGVRVDMQAMGLALKRLIAATPA